MAPCKSLILHAQPLLCWHGNKGSTGARQGLSEAPTPTPARLAETWQVLSLDFLLDVRPAGSCVRMGETQQEPGSRRQDVASLDIPSAREGHIL